MYSAKDLDKLIPQSTTSDTNIHYELDNFKNEITLLLDSKIIDLKKEFQSEMKLMTSQEQRQILEQSKEMHKLVDQLTNFMSVKEINKKGFQKIEEWILFSLNESKAENKLGFEDLLSQYEKQANQKLDLFAKETMIMKSQIDSIKEIRLNINTINSKLDEKATYQNLRNLEYQLEEYAKVQNMQQIIETLATKTTNDDFHKLTAQFNQLHASLGGLKANFQVQTSVQSMFESNFKDFLDQNQKRCQSLEDEINKNQKDLASRLHAIRDQFRNHVKEQDSKWMENHKALEDKASLNELDRLRQLFDKYVTSNHFREFKNQVMPEIASFKKTVADFTESNDQMREMIRRFDEVISEKASKMAIHELEHFVEQSYVKKKYWEKLQEEINLTIEQQQNTVKVMQESVKMFEVNMSEEINNAVKRSLQKTMMSYEKVLNQFQKFFDQEELTKVLERKVDIEYVQTLQDIKANKIDLESCVSLIESVHERLKQMSILQVEMARSLIPHKTSSNFQNAESINQKISRRDQLLKQTQVTCQWIVDFSLKNNLQPGEDELIKGKNSLLSQQTARHISLSDVPSPIRQFEQYHNSMQEKTKLDLPTTLKKWKQQLTQRTSVSSKQGKPQTQGGQLITSDQQSVKQFLGPKNSVQQLQTLTIRRHKRSNQSMRISLNNTPRQADDTISLILGSGDINQHRQIDVGANRNIHSFVDPPLQHIVDDNANQNKRVTIYRSNILQQNEKKIQLQFSEQTRFDQEGNQLMKIRMSKRRQTNPSGLDVTIDQKMNPMFTPNRQEQIQEFSLNARNSFNSRKGSAKQSYGQ